MKMSRILFCIFIIAASTASIASAQTQMSGRRDSVAVRPGDIALAGLLAPVRTQAIRATAVDNSGLGLSVCAGRGQWKCILGGAAAGFISGALIGNAFIPHEVNHQEYACSEFFGCGYYTQCDARCDEPVTKIWAFGFGGAVLGGIGGYYLAKASSR